MISEEALIKKLRRVLAADDDIDIAEYKDSRDYEVLIGIPKRIVLGYLLFRLNQVRQKPYPTEGIPPFAVKLAKVLTDLAP